MLVLFAVRKHVAYPETIRRQQEDGANEAAARSASGTLGQLAAPARFDRACPSSEQARPQQTDNTVSFHAICIAQRAGS
jgi:hypothetical protein